MSYKQGDTKLLAVTSRNLNLTMAYLLTDNYLFIMNPATTLLIKTYEQPQFRYLLYRLYG